MAPMTNAERQKKYREKLRTQNPAKYEEIKTKNAERNKKRKKINECSEKLQDLKRKQWIATQQRCRMKKEKTNVSLTSYREDATLNKDCGNNMSLVRKLQRRLVSQRKLYDEKIKKMKKEMLSLKRKCRRYMQKNRDMISLVDELKSKASEPRESQIAAQEEDKTLQHLNIIQKENEMTPLSKSNSFVEQNLPHIAEEDKEKVKKHLLTYNVLVNAIQDTYENTKKNSERNILKRIVKNKCITKYRKSVITRSVLGLKGSARQRKIIKKNNSIVGEIIKFYNRDDVSRATAGKKEFKTQGKIKKQRRYLLDTLKELYKKYRAEGGRAKLTCFKKYRPYYVIPPKLSDREICGCVKHENVLMKIKKLTSLGMIETTNLNDTLSMVVCKLDSKACAYGECLTCCNKCIEFNEDTCDMNEIVTWDEFATQEHEYINKHDGKMSTTKKVVKKEVRDKLKALTESFDQDLKMMKKHVFNINHQYAQYLSCITNLKSNEVAIHIDFSENYLCKLSTEVQSMHFGASKAQVTLHTGVLYVKGKKPQSFASVSACNDHGPEAIWGHLKPILNYVNTQYPLVNAVHFFSDGPVTQYKQKKNFFLFTNYVKGIGFPYSTWNFSEAGHGKGAADGVGGALKRRLDDLVKHGTDIPDAHTAYTLIKNSDTSIMIFYIREADIAEHSVEEDLAPVPQTMTLHQICNTDKTNVIRFRCLSCFCDAPQRGYCECFDVKTHCLVKTFTKENKSQRSQSFLKRKTTEDDTSQIDKGKKKTKVTVLSDIRYRAENMGYDNLQNYRPFKLKRMKKISKDFDLINSGKENIDYDNPVPSTSGTRNKHVKQSTVKGTQGKKLVKRNSNDSSTDEDDHFSLHDSSDDDFYDELLSDTTGEENNKVIKKDTGTVTEEKQDNCDFTSISTTDGVKNANENVNDENKDKVEPEKVEKEDYDTTMITNTSTAEHEVENTVVTNTNKNEDCNFTHFSTADIEENNKKITETDKNIETKEMPYNIDDSVIVRYYLKNKWKYFIGFIEKIDHKEDSEIMYKIRFLKTVDKPILKFITKKLDYDVVPEICIVKKVQLTFINSKEYIIREDDAASLIYF